MLIQNVSFQVPATELELSNNISQMWDDLFAESRTVDASLVSVKKKFTEVICRAVHPVKYEETSCLDISDGCRVSYVSYPSTIIDQELV